MRKIVVVYSSKYGSTKQYAKWIAEEKGADLIQLNKAKIEILLKYDIIVFGGGVYANHLKFKKFIIKNYNVLKDKKVIIFAVGSSPVTDEAIEKIKKANFNSLDFNNISFYLLRGAFDFNNLSPEDKLIMNIFMLKLKSMEKLDEASQAILECCKHACDWKDKGSIQSLISEIKCIRNEVRNK